ncbi:hypothetical protein BU23DRAFT_480704, partial [Bimuria novae-zelandiae CBS 107.79]
PTEETMAAWNHLTVTPALNLTADEISQLGLSTDSVQWPKSPGGVRIISSMGCIGYLESAHQLHCLHPTNPLYTHTASKIAEMPAIGEAHLEHCVDVIRQRLICTADTSIVTFRWVKGISGAYPNFHTGHVCVDYEGLLGWVGERKADMGRVEGWDYRFREGEGREMVGLP